VCELHEGPRRKLCKAAWKHVNYSIELEKITLAAL
jgi:hypothetical protein